MSNGPSHEHIEALTEESSLCCLCVARGGLEEGLLHGFRVAALAARDGRRASVCFDHRVRLAFVFELGDRIESAFPPKRMG